MIWHTQFLPEAKKDFDDLSGNQKLFVSKSIKKVMQNPLPSNEGGYGKPLSGELSGLLKIKLKKEGLRIVYKLEMTEKGMLVIVVGTRADEEVYEIAYKRRLKYDL